MPSLTPPRHIPTLRNPAAHGNGAFAGLKTDGSARGLYAAGADMASVMGGVMGGHYPAGGINLGPAMTFGYIAGRHAAGATGDGNNNQTIRAKAPAVGTAFSPAHLTVLDLPFRRSCGSRLAPDMMRVTKAALADTGVLRDRPALVAPVWPNVRRRDPQEASKSSQTKYQLLHLQARVGIGSSEPPAAIWQVRRLTNPIQ